MPRRRRLVERMRHIETEARKLASSGLHENCNSIEMALLMQGYREAVKVCAHPWTRSELDRLCDQALRAERRGASCRSNARGVVAGQLDLAELAEVKH